MDPTHDTTNSLSGVSLLHTQPTKNPLLVTLVVGAYSTLSGEHIVMDACSVAIIGYSDETVKFAIQEQLERVAYAHPIIHTTSPPKDLAKFLL